MILNSKADEYAYEPTGCHCKTRRQRKKLLMSWKTFKILEFTLIAAHRIGPVFKQTNEGSVALVTYKLTII